MPPKKKMHPPSKPKTEQISLASLLAERPPSYSTTDVPAGDEAISTLPMARQIALVYSHGGQQLAIALEACVEEITSFGTRLLDQIEASPRGTQRSAAVLQVAEYMCACNAADQLNLRLRREVRICSPAFRPPTTVSVPAVMLASVLSVWSGTAAQIALVRAANKHAATEQAILARTAEEGHALFPSRLAAVLAAAAAITVMAAAPGATPEILAAAANPAVAVAMAHSAAMAAAATP